MRILQIVPGSGDTFYCENCLRDNDLIRALYHSGQDAMVVPLYLPPQLDSADADMSNIFYGGINVYLQQQYPIFRHTPAWVDRFFDLPIFLKLASKMAGMTDAHILGSTTVSMLRGEHGHQKKELLKLVDWIETTHKPDVVLFSNALLLGLAHVLRDRFGCRIVCMLQDEDEFLDVLEEPYKSEAWQTLGERCADVDAFIASSDWYRDQMRERLSIPPEKLHRVYPGLDFTGYENENSAPEPPATPVIGYLSRLYPDKGLDILLEAFLKLREDMPELELRITGGMTAADKPFVDNLKARVAEAGAQEKVHFLPNLERDERRRFLRDLTVLSVPETRGSAFGLYLLESWAMGIPAIQPATGAFPELIQHTGGGHIFDPNTPETCAEALRQALANPGETRKLGQAAQEKVLKDFAITQTCKNVVEILENTLPKERGFSTGA